MFFINFLGLPYKCKAIIDAFAKNKNHHYEYLLSYSPINDTCDAAIFVVVHEDDDDELEFLTIELSGATESATACSAASMGDGWMSFVASFALVEILIVVEVIGVEEMFSIQLIYYIQTQ